MICAVCGTKARVSKGALVKHRIDGHVCDNSGCSAETNERWSKTTNDAGATRRRPAYVRVVEPEE